MSQENNSTYPFQAEVRQLLDIVIHSLYTDKEIFVRELVSNAADALEKLRYYQLRDTPVYEPDQPLEINITTDDTAGTITIQDYGVGLTREELLENIGTIAKSGSKAFAEAIRAAKEGAADAASLIGQFGVGFYSVFMVAKEVKVFTHSYQPEGESLVWSSDGSGSFEIGQAPGTEHRGARIVVRLKEEDKRFAQKSTIQEILKRYSSYVAFPIKLNGEQVNKIEAIWLKSKSEITDEQYKEFYKYQANAFDEPRQRMHLTTDAPIAINALVFTPQTNIEKFGFGRFEPAVGLYCKKVLIDPHPEKLLPDWLRYLKGVVDSPDLPLNISRESMQDSALVHKLQKVITGRYIRLLEEEAKNKPDDYLEFYGEFGLFLKEGITTDPDYRDKLAPLLRFESSLTEPGKTTSLPDYVERMAEEQKAIYYLSGSSRTIIEQGPYLEGFKARNIEVLYLYEPADEFVMSHLMKFQEKELVSGDSSDLELGEDVPVEGEALPEEDREALCSWMAEELGPRVRQVKASKRLIDSPVAALNADAMMTPTMRRMLRSLHQGSGTDEVRVDLEINDRHKLISNLNALRSSDSELAKLILNQLFENALLAAGLADDPRSSVNRVNALLERLSEPRT